MQLSEIWRYPVKSMIGERVDAAELSDDGVAGDRAWAVRDEVRGGIRGAKKISGLMRLAAAFEDGPGSAVTITLPDGTTVRAGDDEANAAVSAALDHEVTLWPRLPPTELDHYRRGAPDSDDLLEELRAIFGREPDEPLPDLSVFPPEILEYESPLGTYFDAFPLLLLTTSSLRSMSEALPDSVVDVRRFRPNLVVDTGDEPGHPERGWAGRTVHVGDVELEVVVGCPRCVMVTQEIDDATPQDRALLRYVVRELDQDVGVYATVRRPGAVHVGDAVTVGDPVVVG
ncbi:MOSC domain-containing protein [Dermatobacter hominis]|uniref:MOSC domain-containing protein n=1 Tax=Dermatobacter hominis TaxID=2884263 RepID=UPI001D0F9C3F|nr:MOSC domain-containing protein [Dermatobacter hominis]UDY34711.1 MOSC domain-containing protein [Dermatobacter hominis]